MASRNEFENLIALASDPQSPDGSADSPTVKDPIDPAGSSRKAIISFISGDAADVAACADTELVLNPDILDDLTTEARAGLDEDRAMELEIQRLAEAARQLADLINHRRGSKRIG